MCRITFCNFIYFNALTTKRRKEKKSIGKYFENFVSERRRRQAERQNDKMF